MSNDQSKGGFITLRTMSKSKMRVRIASIHAVVSPPLIEPHIYSTVYIGSTGISVEDDYDDILRRMDEGQSA